MSRALSSFCNSPFWDEQQTWNTTDPDLSDCFQETVLVWVPAAVLLLLSPLEFYFLLKSKGRQIPWTGLNILKIMLNIIALIAMLIELITLLSSEMNGTDEPSSSISAASIQCSGLLLAMVFIVAERKKGIQSSAVLFFYWFLLSIGGAVTFRTIFRKALDPDYMTDDVRFMTYVIYFPTIIGQLILSVFSDGPVFSEYTSIEKNKCPMDSATFLSRLFFCWFDGMVWKGYKQPIDYSDLWALSPEFKTSQIRSRFDSTRENQIYSNLSYSGERKCPSIVSTMMRAFGSAFFAAILLKLMSDLLVFANPLLLEKLIAFVSTDEPLWHGYFYASSMFALAVCLAVITNQYNFRMQIFGMKVRSALVMAIYTKSLRLSNAARRQTTVGQIVNLMAIDSHLVSEVVTEISILWSAPIQISISLYLIWNLLGPSALAGLAILVLLMPVNTIAVKISRNLQIKVMKIRDERIRMMNEILSGIKVLKLYAWEKSFYNYIDEIRNRELKIMKTMIYIRSFAIFLFQSTPILISVATFAIYTLSDPRNILDATKAFVSLSLFNVMRPSLVNLPMVVTRLIQAVVSLRRIENFMSSKELDYDSVCYNRKEENAITVDNGMFSWDAADPPLLFNVNFKIPKGFLVAVVGPVGSGKSSLLSAMLGEMEKLSGKVCIQGSVAYVPQIAWIQNTTLKNNILFEKKYDKTKYTKIVKACALEPDLKILPGGDETEIGEKGINLSGGQKQRVSLARAVYNSADIYLLDDPMSAVDAHVGKELFDNVLGPNGLLKNKTRILVTHRVTFLSKVDLIIVLNEGECTEIGTYQELLDKKGAFADFLTTYLKEYEDSDDEELLELKEETLAKVESPATESERPRDRSSSRKKSLMSSIEKLKLNRQVSECHKNLNVEGTQLLVKEHTETGKVAWSVYAYYTKSIGTTFALVCLLSIILAESCNVGSNLWLSEWSQDKPINGTQNPELRDLRLGVYGVVGIGQALFVLAFAIFLTLGTLKASTVLHRDMLMNVLHAPMSFFETTPLGRILNRFSKDLEGADFSIPRIIRMLLTTFLHAITTIIVISISTPIFMTVIPVIALLYYIIQKLYIASSRQLKRLESVTRSPIYSHFSETLSGMSTIRAYELQDKFVLQSEKRVDHHQSTFFPRLVSSNWVGLRLEIVGNLIVFASAVFAVLSKDTINAGIVGLSVSYAIQMTTVLNIMIRLWSEMETNIVSVERIKEYCEVESEAPWEIPSTTPPPDWPDTGAIAFQDYSTRYRKELDLVLQKISCNILSGEKIGIVGRTGSGKSTLTQALLRIIEKAEGSILIDGIDISQIGLHDLRSKLTIIPQDPVLFSGTLRKNLDPFENCSDEKIWNALGQAHLKSHISSLKAALDHEVAEGGENFSVGQRQLLCLARALLRKSKILILDEATAAVDLETDDLIQATIRKEFADCTVLTIAHRLNTVMDSSRILVLSDGIIQEFDSPINLLQNKNSMFFAMAKEAGLA